MAQIYINFHIVTREGSIKNKNFLYTFAYFIILKLRSYTFYDSAFIRIITLHDFFTLFFRKSLKIILYIYNAFNIFFYYYVY